MDFSEQVFDKSELEDIMLQRLEKIRDEGSGYEAQELQRKILRFEQLEARGRITSPGSHAEGADAYLQSHELELLDAEAELNPDASEEYIAHTEEMMFFTSNEARQAFQNLSAIMGHGGGSFISVKEGAKGAEMTRFEEAKQDEYVETLPSFMSCLLYTSDAADE